MERNIKTQAVVLSVRRFGDLHKAVTLLSPDLGLLDAIIFGGRKGKKTALAPLFSISEMQLYHNPVRNEHSVVEAVSSFVPMNITEDLACTYSKLQLRFPSGLFTTICMGTFLSFLEVDLVTA